MNPKLSIIVPVYNVGRFLEICVESILAQTFTDFELILVDDGSTDGSGVICDRFAELDNRIKVIHKENGGVVSARKTGLKTARGIYAGYVDGDDRIEKTMYQEMISYMDKYGCDLVMCDVEHNTSSKPLSTGSTHLGLKGGFYDRTRLETEIFPNMLYAGEFYKFGVYPVIWNKLYWRDKLIKFQLDVYDGINVGEDAACVYPYILSSDSMYFMENRSLYHYRHSQNQMTAVFDKMHFERFKLLYDFFINSDFAASPYAGQLDYYFAYLTKVAISNELRPLNTEPFKKKLRSIKEICEFSSQKGFLSDLFLSSFIHRLYFKLVMKKNVLLLAAGITVTRLIQKISGEKNEK